VREKLLTLAEYLENYASAETKGVGYALIERELDKIKSRRKKRGILPSRAFRPSAPPTAAISGFKERTPERLHGRVSAERLHIGENRRGCAGGG